MTAIRSDRERGMTIVEALFGFVLLAILLAAIYVFMSGNIVQRRQLEGYVELQRDARLAILQLQKDLRGLVSVRSLDRGEGGRLERFEFLVPVELDLTAPVRYEYDHGAGTLRRNGDDLITGTIEEMELWLLDEEGRDVTPSARPAEDTVLAVRLRIKVQGEARPGEDKAAPNRSRLLDFTIFPRLPVARMKARQGKLNLTGGRFGLAQDRNASRPGLGSLVPQSTGF